MIAALQPFIGKKVLNVGNSMSEKLREALPRYTHQQPPGKTCEEWFYHLSQYSIWITFRVVDSTDGSTCYQECPVCLGEIEDKILKNLRPVDLSLRTDYTPAEIISAREKLEAAEHEVRYWENALTNFGRYDN